MIKVLMSIIRDIIRADNSRKMNIILTYKELNLEVLISMNLIIISMGNQLLIITKVMSLQIALLLEIILIKLKTENLLIWKSMQGEWGKCRQQIRSMDKLMIYKVFKINKKKISFKKNFLQMKFKILKIKILVKIFLILKKILMVHKLIQILVNKKMVN